MINHTEKESIRDIENNDDEQIPVGLPFFSNFYYKPFQ